MRDSDAMWNIKLGSFLTGCGVAALVLSMVAMLSPSLSIMFLAGAGTGFGIFGLILIEKGEKGERGL